jgi:hypothetical protein
MLSRKMVLRALRLQVLGAELGDGGMWDEEEEEEEGGGLEILLS